MNGGNIGHRVASRDCELQTIPGEAADRVCEPLASCNQVPASSVYQPNGDGGTMAHIGLSSEGGAVEVAAVSADTAVC